MGSNPAAPAKKLNKMSNSAAVRALRLRKAKALLPNTPKIYTQSSQIINFVVNVDNV